MKTLAGIGRLAAVFGCCEMLPLTRAYFGLGYITMLVLMLVLKQHLLQYLPVASGFIVLHQFAAYAALIWLAYRLISLSRSVLAAEIPGEDPGFWGWWPVRWGRKLPLLWLEPCLALVIACFALGSSDIVRFVPLWLGNVPLERCEISGRCMGWDGRAAEWLVQAAAWLPVVALWFNNYGEYRDELERLGMGRKQASKKPRQPKPPEMSVAGGDTPLPD
jgi:hypothetical protein